MLKNIFILVLCTLFVTPYVVASKSSGVPAEKAIVWLKNGNTRYLTSKLRKDGQGAVDREKLSSGQSPHTIVLSCADSRVPPEIIFDQKLGEIFVIRVAGEAVDSSVLASIEYAVEHLGSELILVMGHTSCGAVKAAIAAKEGQTVGSTDLDKLVADIKPRLPKNISSENASVDVRSESIMNAEGVSKDLVKRSKIISEKVLSHKLKIKYAIYDLKTGKVDIL